MWVILFIIFNLFKQHHLLRLRKCTGRYAVEVDPAWEDS